MSNATITPEERAALIAHVNSGYMDISGEGLKKALKALEQAEARAEKAESDKAALEEDLEATEKNLKESSGFIEELLSGLKHRFPVQYAAIDGDEYGDDAFSSHDLFELVIDPAVNAAQKAEAENARLREERDWLAENIADRPCAYDSCPFGLPRPTGPDYGCGKTHVQCWQKALTRAVAAGEGE